MPATASSCICRHASSGATDADYDSASRRSFGARLQTSASSSTASWNDLRAVETKLPTRLLDEKAFARTGNEGGIGIVDVDEDLASDLGAFETLERSFGPGHRRMA